MTAIVEARGLRVERGGRCLVRDLDLAAGRGEAIALVGRNGSGKTSLLRILAGLDAPEAGTVTWQGGPVLSGAERCRILGVVLQGEVPARFTVREMVTLGLGLDRPATDAEQRRVTGVLESFGIAGMAGRRCDRLSGGEWQRVTLARASVAEPALLLLDEPASQLDPGRRVALAGWLRRLRGRVTSIVATHDLDWAATCDRLVLLGDGGRWASGSPAQVLTPDRIADCFQVAATIHRDRDRLSFDFAELPHPEVTP